MDGPGRILVIPSIRESCLKDFLEAWGTDKGGWDAVILVEDNPEKSFKAQVAYHFSWAEIDKVLGKDAWIISRRDSAIRCFGFLIAWWLGAKYVLTLDDDCLPVNGHTPLFDRHMDFMYGHNKWVPSVPGIRTRGLPYENLGSLSSPPVINIGLWEGVADFDGVQTLAHLSAGGRMHNFTPPLGNRIIPRGQYVPMCGMNLCFAREATPFLYFPLMGQDSPYARFDDIWAGVIAKRLCDHLGERVSVGEPFVKHVRASDPFQNLVKEAPGIAANETFWQQIDAVPLGEPSASAALRELASGLQESKDAYISRLGSALDIWDALLCKQQPSSL